MADTPVSKAGALRACEFKSHHRYQIMMKIKSTYWAKIYIAGPVDQIEQVCREYCTEVGLCVTVTPTKFIYKYGEETGVEVGLINYPRFPASPDEIDRKAMELGELILQRTYQGSFSLMTPTQTTFVTRRPRDTK